MTIRTDPEGNETDALFAGPGGRGEVTLTWTPSQTSREEFGPVGYAVYADGFGFWSTTSTTTRFPLLDPALQYELTGDEEFTVVASDLAMAESPPSNGLVATPR